jgi:hypothetical protein
MERFSQLMNCVPQLLLRSPLHGLMSNRYLLITFTARKSGKRYTTPVAYLATSGGGERGSIGQAGCGGCGGRISAICGEETNPPRVTEAPGGPRLGSAVGRALGLDLGEERVLQTYALPLEALARATPAFDPAAVKTIRLHFDAPSGGALLLDRIGFASR